MGPTHETTDPSALFGEAEAFECFGEYEEALHCARRGLREIKGDASARTKARARRLVARYELLARAAQAAEGDLDGSPPPTVAPSSAPSSAPSTWSDIVAWIKRARGPLLRE
jgi:hypothetical protein